MLPITPVTLSGGSGTRPWPQYPKQYLPLVGDNTMLQETILRLSGLDNLADPIIICNTDHLHENGFFVGNSQVGLKSEIVILLKLLNLI